MDSPRSLKRHIGRILPFAVIWLIFGLLYVVVEYGLLGNSGVYPATGNQYHFVSSLTYILIGSFFLGLFQGWMEVSWFRKLYEKKPIWKRIILKGTVYTFLLIVFFLVLGMFANARTYSISPFDPVIFQTLYKFINSFAFWSVIIYGAMVVDFALFYSEITYYVGNEVLYNYSFGKYHKPITEMRIFMFLDMKSSTRIAEELGHEKYFHFIKAYYADMTKPILDSYGEIYQYVGDEIVVSWSEAKGLKEGNCVNCFLEIKSVFEERKTWYLEHFGIVPQFKAGFHLGEVTTGVIGIVKKDIIYTGDPLNTTARIQEQCNYYRVETLISQVLMKRLEPQKNISYTKVAEMTLRGKKDKMALYQLQLSMN